jgi:photosystem II stability/assembly factor-like uncharacterized protein
MKKGVVLVSFFLFSLVLSGCSLTSKNTTTGTVEQYTFSKSIWISKDSGKTWKESNVTLTKPRLTDINPLNLVFDPQDQNVAYVGLRSGGIMKTTNRGDNWEFLTFKTDKVYGLAINQTDPKTIYASTVVKNRGKIFKNSNFGANDAWTEIYTAATNGPLTIQLVIDKKNPNTIYVATSDNQVIKSVDGGVSWRNIFEAPSPVVKISLDVKDSRLVYLLTKSGEVFFSSNGGDKFESLTKKITATGLFGSGFNVIETDPTHGKWIYLAGKTGIIRSKDAGDSWEAIVTLNNPDNSPVGAVAINPRNSDEIIYGAQQATYRSIDGGKNWSTSQFDLPKAVNILEYNPLDPSIVYAGFSGN